jgi:hypothetical protein
MMKRATKLVILAFAVFCINSVYAQPGKPSLTLPSNTSIKVSLTPSLSWYISPLPDNFRLQIATDSLFTTPVFDSTQNNVTVYTVPAGKLNNYVVYYWRVRGSDTNGDGDWSDIFSFRTIDSQPVEPVLVSPKDNSINAAAFPDLRWNAVPHATRYQLQVSKNSSFTSNIKLDSTFDGARNTLLYDRDTLKIDSIYYWRVRAENETGWGAWSNSFVFTVHFLPPSVPMLQLPANGSVNQALNGVMEWTEAKQTTKYRVFVSTNPQLTPLLFKDSVATSFYTLPLDVLAFDTSTTYYWTVQAGNDDNFYSRTTDTFMFTTTNIYPPSRPSNVSPNSATVQSTRTPTFTWSETSTYPADSFFLHIATFNNFSDSILFKGLTTKSYTIPAGQPLPYHTVFYWRVAGKNDGGLSPWSYFWNITTGITNPTKNTFLATLYPNPATTSTTFAFELAQSQQVRVTVIDITGKEIMEVFDGTLSADKHSFDINTSALPAGNYYTVIGGNSAMQAIPFIKK